MAVYLVVRQAQHEAGGGMFTTERPIAVPRPERRVSTWRRSDGRGFAPALTGADFQGNWNDLSVGDFFERIRISMPPSGPSSVTPEQKVDIVAHIFNQNKYPAGTTELEPKTEVLKTIKIELKKP
jgi:hypothetical protein